MGLIQL